MHNTVCARWLRNEPVGKLVPCSVEHTNKIVSFVQLNSPSLHSKLGAIVETFFIINKDNIQVGPVLWTRIVLYYRLVLQ